MMALIDRDELIEKIRDDGILDNGYSDSEREEDVIDMIESCQTFDAVPISSLIKLRDWLFEHDAITLEGRRWLDNLIGENKT